MYPLRPSVPNPADLTNVWMGVAVLFPHAMLLVSHLANLFPTSKFKQVRHWGMGFYME